MITDGNPAANIYVIGETPGEEDLRKKRAFSGFDGIELDNMGNSAGINFRSQAYLFNIADRPIRIFYKATEAKTLGITKVDGKYPHPEVLAGRERIRELLRKRRPNLVIILGAPALWAITGLDGIGKWRGSILEWEGIKIIPTYNPAMVRKNYPLRWQIVQDFRRCFAEAQYPEIRYPAWNFTVRPTFSEAMDWLNSIKPGGTYSADSETRGGQITCWGIASNTLDAICIPFMTMDPEKEYSYWTPEEEHAILLKLREVSTHPEINWIFQNGLYDAQYTAYNWGFRPNIVHDTMIMQHVCFPNLKKSLDFISSIVCDYYRYWKDDGKEWDASIPEDEHWDYNCRDCTYTYECFQKLQGAIEVMNLKNALEFQMRRKWSAYRRMLRGINIDKEYKTRMAGELLKAQKSRGEWFETVLGHPFNPDSNPQMKALLYDDLGLPTQYNGYGADKSPTCDDKALEALKLKAPIAIPLIETVQESRSIRVFRSNFAEARLDHDGRMRSSENPTGTITFRYSYSKNPWNGGCNLQTIPAGTEED